MKTMKRKIKSLRKFYESEMVKDKVIPDNILYDKVINQRDFVENTLFPGMGLTPFEIDTDEPPRTLDRALYYDFTGEPVAYWTDGDAIIVKNDSGQYYFYQTDDCEGWPDEKETVQSFMYDLSEYWHWGGSTDEWDYKREEIEGARDWERWHNEWEEEDWIDNGYMWSDEKDDYIDAAKAGFVYDYDKEDWINAAENGYTYDEPGNKWIKPKRVRRVRTRS